MLPFGLRSAPKFFTAVADALEWILRDEGVEHVDHYLDDYILFGPPGSDKCAQQLEVTLRVCERLGVPLAKEKLEGPTECLTFLGIELDTRAGILRLPEDKLGRIRVALDEWERKRACTKRELESLIGTLQHACRVVRPGRPFLRRMIDLSKKARRAHHYVRLNQEFRADLRWWRVFIERWNGVAVVPSCGPPQFVVTSDASGQWGCGAWCQTSWFQFRWPETASPHHIAFKELMAILLAAAAWGDRWYGTRVQWFCDNYAAVRVVSSRSCQDQSLMHLLCCLFMFEARYQFQVVASHIPGVDNTLADDLSRDRLSIKGSRDGTSPVPLPQLTPNTTAGGRQLDVSTLDEGVRFYFQRGLANSTHRTYRAGVNRYISFCAAYHIADPFPVDEAMLCYFVVMLARDGLAPATIKTYLAVVRHTQIERGFPDMREASSLPRLQLVQRGVRRERAERGPPPLGRLPITPAILGRMRRVLLPRPETYEAALTWAAATTCFFGFFRAGEITVPSVTEFDPAVHLSWGDVSTDAGSPPSKVRVFLTVEDRPIWPGGCGVAGGDRG